MIKKFEEFVNENMSTSKENVAKILDAKKTFYSKRRLVSFLIDSSLVEGLFPYAHVSNNMYSLDGNEHYFPQRMFLVLAVIFYLKCTSFQNVSHQG